MGKSVGATLGIGKEMQDVTGNIRPFCLRDKEVGISLSEVPERKAQTSNFISL